MEELAHTPFRYEEVILFELELSLASALVYIYEKVWTA